jgi:hypothetical protein
MLLLLLGVLSVEFISGLLCQPLLLVSTVH